MMIGKAAIQEIAVAVAGCGELFANTVILVEKSDLKIRVNPFDKDSAIEPGSACTDDSNFHLYK